VSVELAGQAVWVVSVAWAVSVELAGQVVWVASAAWVVSAELADQAVWVASAVRVVSALPVVRHSDQPVGARAWPARNVRVARLVT
jgi:hypothetical protein